MWISDKIFENFEPKMLKNERDTPLIFCQNLLSKMAFIMPLVSAGLVLCGLDGLQRNLLIES